MKALLRGIITESLPNRVSGRILYPVLRKKSIHLPSQRCTHTLNRQVLDGSDGGV